MRSIEKSLREIFLLILILSYNCIYSQNSLTDIDLDLIPQKRVREFITHQIEQKQIYFSDIKASCPNENDIVGFHRQIQSFIVGDSIAKVWNSYVTANPSYTWEGNILSFGMLLSKQSNRVMYRNQQYKGIEIGQVFYINLKLWRGVYNLAVAFEVIGVDEKTHTIEFSYIQGGRSLGRQTIQFKKCGNNRTSITHYSYFKSDSNFRDSILYPFFHSRVVDEFHSNMKRLICEGR